LQSTKSTILENWPGPINLVEPAKPVYHFAVKQAGVNLDFHLKQFYRDKEISFHYFEQFEELVTICQRFTIDLIIIGGRGEFLREIEMVQAIKQNVFLSIIPIVLYHPEPSDSLAVAAYENGAEDFIHGEWVDQLEKVRIRQVIERNRRDLAVNPSTRLPGAAIIEQEIMRQLEMQAEFAVCYADLDNFKAYNDYYGYVRGDKVIKLTARIVKDVVFDVCREGFVGHIAGDDFIFIIPIGLIDLICSMIIKTFDSLIPYRYEAEDRERGTIKTVNRRGEWEEFPLLTISIAVLPNIDGKFEHVGEMSRMLADLKKATKRLPGSNYMIERRRKY
jgi:GGDEF domain-containing protein